MAKLKCSWFIVISVILMIYGCASYIRISDIKANPDKYENKQVTVKGRVTETLAIPFINKGMYQISDNSESIWVMSKREVPFRGDNVIVKGEVRTAININKRNFGTVIVEN